jgi:hypothetical protein
MSLRLTAVPMERVLWKRSKKSPLSRLAFEQKQ